MAMMMVRRSRDGDGDDGDDYDDVGDVNHWLT